MNVVEDVFNSRECKMELDLSDPAKENYLHKFKVQIFDIFPSFFFHIYVDLTSDSVGLRMEPDI